MPHAKQPKTTEIHQSQDNMAWMVRHCSPLLYIHTTAYADWAGHKPNTTGQRDRCASLDFSSLRLKIYHR